MEKYGFIYIWYDRKRKMYYVGSHWGTETDGYICSSNRMRDAYRRRPHDFKRRILKRNIKREELLQEEYNWLSLIDEKDIGVKYYNLRKHKWGHWSTDESSRKSIAEKLSEKHTGKKYPNRKKPKPFSEEHKRKMSERMKGNTLTLGRSLSDEHKKILSEKNKGRVHNEESINRIKEARKKQVITEETKKKISETQKGKKLSDETRRKMSESKKGLPKVPGSGRKRKAY